MNSLSSHKACLYWTGGASIQAVRPADYLQVQQELRLAESRGHHLLSLRRYLNMVEAGRDHPPIPRGLFQDVLGSVGSLFYRDERFGEVSGSVSPKSGGIVTAKWPTFQKERNKADPHVASRLSSTSSIAAVGVLKYVLRFSSTFPCLLVQIYCDKDKIGRLFAFWN